MKKTYLYFWALAFIAGVAIVVLMFIWPAREPVGFGMRFGAIYVVVGALFGFGAPDYGWRWALWISAPTIYFLWITLAAVLFTASFYSIRNFAMFSHISQLAVIPFAALTTSGLGAYLGAKLASPFSRP
jgi:hypothetical protein